MKLNRIPEPRIRRGVFFLIALFAGAGVAPAEIVFQVGNHPQPDEETIQLNSGDIGTTVFGTTNQTGLSVAFSSTTDTLSAPSSGAARIEAIDGVLNNITISIPGGFFGDLILNPFQGSGDATLTAIMNEPGGGTQSFDFVYALGNGQNFVTMFATGGETIQSLTINAPGGFSDLRQPRISGAAAVPAPSTMVMLATGLLPGLTMLVRSRRKARAGR